MPRSACDLPLRINAPGIQSRGASLVLALEGGDVRLGLALSLNASLPGLPVQVSIDGAGLDLPVLLGQGAPVGLDPQPAARADA